MNSLCFTSKFTQNYKTNEDHLTNMFTDLNFPLLGVY
jgi:hypothetical protein